MVGYRHISRRRPDRVADAALSAQYGSAAHTEDPPETQDVHADTGVSRALSLAATLIDASPTGLTKAEIRERVEHYRSGEEASGEAFEQQFSRDKRHLRGLGIRITEQGAPGAESGETRGGDHEFRYLIDPSDHGLPPLDLEADEVIALRHAELLWSGTRAQAAIRQAAGALLTLSPAASSGGSVGSAAAQSVPVEAEAGESGPDTQPSAVRLGLADDHVLDHLGELAEALHSRAVTFVYGPRGRHRTQRRRTVPLGVGSRGGWYLVGHDLDRDAVRVYRLDRIRGGIITLAAGRERSGEDEAVMAAAQILEDIAAGRIDPQRITREQLDTLGPAHGTETAELEVDADVAAVFLPHALPEAAPAATGPDCSGPRRLVVETTLHDSFLGRLAVALPGVRVRTGDRLRDLVEKHLESVLRAHAEPPGDAVALKAARRAAKNDAGVKIARVLNMAAYLHASGGARVSDLLERYSVEPRQLHRDLLSLQQAAAFDSAYFGHYIDITPELPLNRRIFEKLVRTEDPVIRVELPGEQLSSTLGRPLRLTAPQALSLLIALEGLIASEGAGEEPVRQAAQRLRDRIRGIVPEELDATAAELSVAWHSDDEFDREPALREALVAGHAVELLYEDVQGRRSRRIVDPVTLLHDGARSYLRAWCRTAHGERNFLLSRMLELKALPETPQGEEARRLAAEPARRPEVPRLPDDVLVTLRFAPSAAAGGDAWGPLREAWHPDGARTAEVALRSGAIAVDLALRSGGDVTVVDPEDLAEEVVRRAEAGLSSLRGDVPRDVEYPGEQTKGRTP